MTATESATSSGQTPAIGEPMGADAPTEPTFEQLAGAVDAGIRALDELDPDARRAATDLKDAVEAFHRPALVHLVRTLRADPAGKELLFQLVDEPSVRAVFALHGIIRADPLTRANQALDRVRPYLQSHGGDVELVAIEGSIATVRLHGACNGCSMSAQTLREGVERALVEEVDEIEGIEVEEDAPTTAFIPLGSVGRRPAADAGWVAGPAVSGIDNGAMARFDVDVDGTSHSFVVTNVDHRFAVFRNECVHQGMTLDGGEMADRVLTCPWHGFRFDASTGECISAPGAQLQGVPTRIDDGRLWVRADGR